MPSKNGLLKWASTSKLRTAGCSWKKGVQIESEFVPYAGVEKGPPWGALQRVQGHSSWHERQSHQEEDQGLFESFGWEEGDNVLQP